MSLRSLLEPFDESEPVTNSAPNIDVDVDAVRSASYEAGYASGWEDAQAAECAARGRIEAELERNIQNLAFTYHEAVDRVRGELTHFLATFIDVFLPATIPVLLKEFIRGELLALSDSCLEGHVEVVVGPDCEALVEGMLEKIDMTLDVRLVSETNLATHQIFVRVPEREYEIDFSPVLQNIEEQFAALISQDIERKFHAQ